MSVLLTPPSTAHRTDKENRVSSKPAQSRVVWSTKNQYHILGSPTISSTRSISSKDTPVKSILKKIQHDFLAPPLEAQREVTPEPADPLVNLNYLDYPMSLLLTLDASLRDLIEGYNVLAARLRGSVLDSTDADASWPLFQPLRKNSQAFVNAVVRDITRVLDEPWIPPKMDEEECKDEAILSLPSPKSSPTKKRCGMTAEQAKYARDISTTCHSVLKLLGVMLSIPAIHNVFNDAQLREIMTAVLAIPISAKLPTPNARKTFSLSIWLLQVQRLPSEVLLPLRDRITNAIRRGIEGELGKEGKKGSANDGLKAIHDLCIFQPSTFVPAFTVILPSIFSSLLSQSLVLRTQACHALGGFVIGSTSIPRSYVHTRIANATTSFITNTQDSPKRGIDKPSDSPIVRTLRATLVATEPLHVAQGPVWALSVIASLIVLLGSQLCTNIRMTRIMTALLSLTMRHKRNSVRALVCLIWRPVAWAYFSPRLPSNIDSDGESEVEEDADRNASETNARKAYWKITETVVELQAGISTIAAVLDVLPIEESLHKTYSILNNMLTKSNITCEEAVALMKRLVSSETQAPEWTLNKLLPHSLFSSNPGLLSVDYESISGAVKMVYEQVPTIDDIRCLTVEEITTEGVFDGFITVWKKALTRLVVYGQTELPPDLVSVWNGLLAANVSVLRGPSDMESFTENYSSVTTDSQDENNPMPGFATRVVDVIIDILQDEDLDFRPKSPPTRCSSPIKMERLSDMTNGLMKLNIAQRLWVSMPEHFSPSDVEHASENLLVCLMSNEEELVGSNDAARIAWSLLCTQILTISDYYTMQMFWGYEPLRDGTKQTWNWTTKMRALVWRTCVQTWREEEANTNGAALLLGIPFTDAYSWTLASEDCELWEQFLEHAFSKALDYGVDSVTVIDNIACFIHQNQTPTRVSSSRAPDLLMANLDMSDARDIPVGALEFVNEAMLTTYPPEPRNKEASLWLVRALQTIIGNCPPELCLRLFETIQEGLCLWFSDDYKAWTTSDLEYDIIPLYQHFLLRVEDLPKTSTTLEAVMPVLESVFSGREDMPELIHEAFHEFWQSTYSEISPPKGVWPTTIQDHYLSKISQEEVCESSSLNSADEVAEEISELDENLGHAFITFPAASSLNLSTSDIDEKPTCSRLFVPSTPTSIKDSSGWSPPRPHKPSPGLFEAIVAPRSPQSPIRVRKISNPRTPVRTPRSAVHGLCASSSRKRRRIADGDKENASPNQLGNITPIADRIAMTSPLAPTSASSLGIKPFSLSKRCLERDGHSLARPSPSKKARFEGQSPSSSNSLDIEEERLVETSLLTVPFPTLEKSPSSGSVSLPASPFRKRKRAFMESVEIPRLARSKTISQLRHTGSMDSLAFPPKTPSTKGIRQMRSISNAENFSIRTSVKRRRSDSGPLQPETPSSRLETLFPDSDDSVITYGSERKAMLKRVEQLSSDDDPHFGQVTPHHIISPALRKYQDSEHDDASSDDMPSSPVKRIVSRRLRRIESFTICSPT